MTQQQQQEQPTARERVGFNVRRGRASRAIELIRQAEEAGVETVWMTQSAVGSDVPTIYAAAAAQTERIKLGTSIVPAFTRHPLALAGQALVLDDIAPGRLRLGVGTSHGALFAKPYGEPLDHPLDRMREYVSILRGILHDGAVDRQGRYYNAGAKFPGAPKTPVLMSALREHSWELAGEVSDGGISWLCPVQYLHDVAKPALQRGAAKASRATPPLVAHISVAFGSDSEREAIRAATRQQYGYYTQLPFYTRMFAAAGFPLTADNQFSDAFLDDMVITGDDDGIAAALHNLLDGGLDELLVMLIPVADPPAEEARLLRLLGGM